MNPAGRLLRDVEDQLRRRPVDAHALHAAWQRLEEDATLRTAALQLAVPVAARLRAGAPRTDGAVAEQVLGHARQVLQQAGARVASDDLRAAIALEAALVELDSGSDIDVDVLLGSTTRALLAAERWARIDDRAQAAALTYRALWGLYHRNLHFEDVVSPLSSRPVQEYLAPLSHSPVPQAPRGGARPISPATRFVVLHHGNLHFARGIVEHLREQGAIADVVDTASPVEGLSRPSLDGLVLDRLTPASEATAPVPRPGSRLGQLLSRADVVFVDWALEAAVWASIHVPDSVRLVVRLHSIEALSPHPHVMDLSRVDDLVFVSPPLRDLTVSALPAADTARLHVIPNDVRLRHFHRAKTAQADRTLALVGWASAVKDPIHALEVLSLLRREEPTWRLLLVGHGFGEAMQARGRRYSEAFEERRRRPDVEDAVVETGHVDDLPELMRDVGYILSTSLRESFHVGLVEGAASGALPVVRDWPVLRPWGGPRRLFPDEWVVDDAAAAADRVLQHADPVVRSEAGEAARRWVVGRYDWSVTRALYDQLLPVRQDG